MGERETIIFNTAPIGIIPAQPGHPVPKREFACCEGYLKIDGGFVHKKDLNAIEFSGIIFWNIHVDIEGAFMKDLSLLVWLTQLGFSVAFPLAGFILLAKCGELTL